MKSCLSISKMVTIHTGLFLVIICATSNILSEVTNVTYRKYNESGSISRYNYGEDKVISNQAAMEDNTHSSISNNITNGTKPLKFLNKSFVKYLIKTCPRELEDLPIDTRIKSFLWNLGNENHRESDSEYTQESEAIKNKSNDTIKFGVPDIQSSEAITENKVPPLCHNLRNFFRRSYSNQNTNNVNDLTHRLQALFLDIFFPGINYDSNNSSLTLSLFDRDNNNKNVMDAMSLDSTQKYLNEPKINAHNYNLTTEVAHLENTIEDYDCKLCNSSRTRSKQNSFIDASKSRMLNALQNNGKLLLGTSFLPLRYSNFEQHYSTTQDSSINTLNICAKADQLKKNDDENTLKQTEFIKKICKLFNPNENNNDYIKYNPSQKLSNKTNESKITFAKSDHSQGEDHHEDPTLNSGIVVFLKKQDKRNQFNIDQPINKVTKDNFVIDLWKMVNQNGKKKLCEDSGCTLSPRVLPKSLKRLRSQTTVFNDSSSTDNASGLIVEKLFFTTSTMAKNPRNNDSFIGSTGNTGNGINNMSNITNVSFNDNGKIITYINVSSNDKEEYAKISELITD